jgi:hypothetical protein
MPFDATENRWSYFVISFTENPKNDFGVFARGYHLAAFKLAELLLSAGSFREYEAYPVVFLYRQSFELYLKNVIYKAALLSAFKQLDDIDSALYNNHKLPLLAEKATGIVRKLFPDDKGLADFLNQVTETAGDFAEIDADSYAYRYPIDKRGNSSTQPHQAVNLYALHTMMNALLEGFETLDFGLDVETYHAQEVYEILLSIGV